MSEVRGLAKMVTGTKFRGDRSRGLLYLRARKFEPVTTFAESTILPQAVKSAVTLVLYSPAVPQPKNRVVLAVE